MAVMLGQLYAALKAADVSDDLARKAAEEVATYENRLANIEARLAKIESDVHAIQTSQTRMFTTMLACFALQTTLTLAGFGWVLNKLP